MGGISKKRGRKGGLPKNPRIVSGKFPNQAGANLAKKKITDALGEGALTITKRDGVEVWTVRKPTLN